MPIPRRWTPRLLWAVCVLVAAGPITGSAAPTDTATPAPTIASESPFSRYPSGRIRKLHLVRPDLIPYPLSYEIVC